MNGVCVFLFVLCFLNIFFHTFFVIFII